MTFTYPLACIHIHTRTCGLIRACVYAPQVPTHTPTQVPQPTHVHTHALTHTRVHTQVLKHVQIVWRSPAQLSGSEIPSGVNEYTGQRPRLDPPHVLANKETRAHKHGQVGKGNKETLPTFDSKRWTQHHTNTNTPNLTRVRARTRTHTGTVSPRGCITWRKARPLELTPRMSCRDLSVYVCVRA